MYSINPPPLSKAGWIWLREWQHKKGISDEDFASGLKIHINTLKSYDNSAHTLTIEKIDNLVATVGEEPIVYVFKKYMECIANLRGSQAYTNPMNSYNPQEPMCSGR